MTDRTGGERAKTSDQVYAAERGFIDTRRPADRKIGAIEGPRGDKPMYDTIGLALSGGGIRSAAFCLGALQAMAKHDLLKRIDYLSTVSGGGYAGAAMTAAMAREKGGFPFYSATGEKNDTVAMRSIRDGSNYLIPHGPRDLLVDVAIMLRGFAANMLRILPILLIAAALTLHLKPDGLALWRRNELPFGLKWVHEEYGDFGFTWWSLVVLALLFAAWALWRGLAQASKSETGGYAATAAGLALLIPVLVFAIELQPVVIRQVYFAFVTDRNWTLNDKLAAIAGSGATLSLAVTFFGKYLGDVVKSSEAAGGIIAGLKRVLVQVMMWLAALVVPFLLWALYIYLVFLGLMRASSSYDPPFFIAALAYVPRLTNDIAPITAAYLTSGCLLLLTWLLWWPNANSLHRLYRDRLSKTFVEKMDAQSPKPVKLSALAQQFAPFHLINCALNIKGDPAVNQRGRNADFFHLSKLFCGSEATGYVATDKLEALDPSLDLATAMAISGAAVSSNMGSQSAGLFSIPLALLNLRLGYWMPNPMHVAKGVRPPWPTLNLAQETFSRLGSKSGYIYLTDGGHVENLGLYELLRRRCQLIVAVDAEADPKLRFPAFVQLQRYARIDLGVRISLPLNRIAETLTRSAEQPRRGAHCAVGEIEYGEGLRGILIYVKASLTGDENDYVMDYARRHAAFPHETTSDQFFNEEQFEVYRALGFHAADRSLGGDDVVEQDGGDAASFGRAFPADTLLRQAAHVLAMRA
jgi:hypothetical protein